MAAMRWVIRGIDIHMTLRSYFLIVEDLGRFGDLFGDFLEMRFEGGNSG